MSLRAALVLGLVQGLTEFLPISSSAHLILASWAVGWPDQGLAFDMAVHAGSLVAIVALLRRELAELVRGLAASLRQPRATPTPAGRLARALLLATVPVAVTGLLAQELVATQARRVGLIAATSIGFGLLLGWADRWGRGQRVLAGVGWRDALLVGFAQALAIVPGVSRSGVTMTAALFLGLGRTDAARFSFLLSVPVGLLVAAKDAVDLGVGGLPRDQLGAMAIGFAVAAVSAYAAADALLAWLRRGGMLPFVVYRVVLGIWLLVWA